MSFTTGPVGKHDHVEIDVVAKYINPRLSQQTVTVMMTDWLTDVLV